LIYKLKLIRKWS